MGTYPTIPQRWTRSNLNIFSELSSLEGDNISLLMRHLTDGLQAERG